MKNLKRISTVLIACVMMLSMCIPAFAATTVNTGSGSNELYIHKIDQSTLEKYLEADHGAGSYSGSTTANTGAELADSAVIGVWTLTAGGTENVTVGDIATYEADGTYGAVYLANIPFTIKEVKLNASATAGSSDVTDYTEVSGGTAGSGTTDTDGVLHFTGLTNGYYRVTETSNSTSNTTVDFIIALPYDPTGSGTTSNVVHAYPKNKTNDAPDIDKEIPEVNGNVITYKITADVPSTINGTMGTQIFKITDTMDSRTSLNTGSIEVYYKTSGVKVSLDGSTDYSYTYSGNVLTVTLESSGYTKLAAAIAGNTIDSNQLYVEYKATVSMTDDELAGLALNPVTNKAELDFTNDSGTSYHKDKEITTSKLAGIKIVKQDGSDNSVKLANAVFGVYTDSAATTPLTNSAGTAITLTTGSNGEVTYNGIGAGTYYIKEITAPSGYKLVSGVQTLTVTQSNADNQETVSVTVDNYFDNGFTLPVTGGTGTMLFTIAGIALIAVSGLVFFMSRRKKNASN